MNTNINYEGLISKIGDCCLTPSNCGSCKKGNCLIGYCRQSLTSCLRQQDDFLDGGLDQIPNNDMKVYDDDTVVSSLAYLLKQCRNCNLYHDEDCIINIVRSTYEIILFGEALDYKGSTLMYLNDMKSIDPSMADRVMIAFQNVK
ncbi:hypothetical protein HYG86_03800 [Alkalicella caledoniensis]|uniref:Uncharacterized protein n=1 Tax=Alkalicella caledoniensis TaxID=2731377 RepID=A0A7G9W5J2_ALKCA|nr:hypothetical protein [Alkalicella caledoniensis]QNO13954.1 hypothetical protein HYG86_03800 [Alkalicella caledoniensis]